MVVKRWIWILGTLTGLIIMISFDYIKSYKEAEPPIPIVTVGDQEAAVTLGTFQWNDEPLNTFTKEEIIAEASTTTINPLQDIQIRFPDPIPANFTVSSLEEMKEGNETKLLQISSTHNYQIPNQPGSITVIISASWGKKRQADYYVSLEREEVLSYQELLSEENGSYSTLIIYPSDGGDPFQDTPMQTGIVPIYHWKGTDNLDSIQKQFPDLDIKEAPAYLVFDHEKLLIHTKEIDELTQFFLSNYQPRRIDLHGLVMQVDRDNHLVNISGTKFFSEEIDNIKVGQEAHAVVSFNHLTDPKKSVTHFITVQREAPDFVLEDTWKSKRPNQYSILGVGDEDFLHKLANHSSSTLKNVEKHLELINNVKEPMPMLGHTITLFNQNEAVLMAYDIEEILRYIESNPLTPK
ncbi:hypothetical protein [Bacillus dakarensis]|uniref:hypothetical protein n=1 Tax=Robertmurraya dakarensis TaxID=1926278 RepID=UPI0009820D6A|nr:hypothetical protein [Bacillus dakarensis]